MPPRSMDDTMKRYEQSMRPHPPQEPARPDPGPQNFDADVANSLYGEEYGTDWEYVG